MSWRMKAGEYLCGVGGFAEGDSFGTWGDSFGAWGDSFDAWGDSGVFGDSGLGGATAAFGRYTMGFKTM